jgi:Concanavalin A-like lectin/glucanases superfamily
MKAQSVCSSVAAALASCLLAAGAYAADYTLGLKFGNNQVFWTASPLQPTEVAGFLPQANWNVFGGNGSLGTGANDGPVADANGVSTPTSVILAWHGNNDWAVGSGTGAPSYGNDGWFFQSSAPPLQTPDWKLMANYLDDTPSTTTTITISNVPPQLTSGGYSLYVYGQPVGATQGGRYHLVDAVSGTQLASDQFLCVPNNIQDYLLSSATSWPDAQTAAKQANVAVFSGLTSANIQISCVASNNRCDVQAIQLVATHSATEPAAATGLQVVKGAPGSYNISWTASAGTSGALVMMSAGTYGISRRPLDGVSYAANSVFGSGQLLGTDVLGEGNYVVYSGPNQSVTVSGLGQGPYNVAVFPYSGSTGDGSVNYNLTSPATALLVPGPVTVQSVTFTTPATLREDGVVQSQVLANYDIGPAVDVTFNANTVYVSADPTKVTVNGRGVLTGGRVAGPAQIAAYYTNGVTVFSATNTVQIVQAAAADAVTNSYSVGVKFAFGYNGQGNMLSTDFAGFLPQTNWNVTSPAVGSLDGAAIVVDNNGVVAAPSTAMHIDWQANNPWYVSSGLRNSFQPGTGDNRLMATYLDTTAASTTTITVSNIPPELTKGGYDVIVYSMTTTTGQGGSCGIVDPNTGAALSVPYFARTPSSHIDYLIVTNTDWNSSASRPADLVVFHSLTNDSLVIYATPTNGNNRADIQGIQLVATHTATEPAAASGLQVSSPTAGTLTISWQTNASTRGSLVLVSAGVNGVSRSPVDGVAYVGNSVYGAGERLGFTNWVVYSGPGTNVTVTGLFTAGPYWVSVFPYNGSPAGGTANYNIENAVTASSGAIVPQFSIQPQPAPAEVLPGSTASFGSGAVGLAPITYRWQMYSGGAWVSLTNNTKYSGSTNNVLTIANAATTDPSQYRLLATNGASLTVTSSVVSLVVDRSAIAVDFSGNGNSQSAVNGWTLAATDMAGVLPQANWYQINNRGGNGGAIVNGNTVPLSDYAGNSTAVQLLYGNFNDAWYNAGGVLTDPNGEMMYGIMKDYGGKPGGLLPDAYLTFTNLLPGSYSVILYGNDSDGGNGAVLSVATGGNTYYWNEANTFQGTLIQAPPSTDVGNPGAGDYLALTGLSPDANGNISVVMNWISGGMAYGYGGFGLAGVQLVAATGSFRIQPAIITEAPRPGVLYAGRNATFSVTAESGYHGLTYQWQSSTDGGVTWHNVVNDARVSGATAASLTIANVGSADAISYRVIVTDAASNSATSSVVGLTIAPPPPANSYAAQVLACNPLAYYRLDEASGTANVFDYVGDHTGLYARLAAPGQPGVPNPPYVGLETTNLSFLSGNVTGQGDWLDACASVPFGTLAGMSNVTFTMWIYSTISQLNPGPGLIVDREGGGGGGGVMYNGGTGGAVNLAYQWNTNMTSTNILTRKFDSGLLIPDNVWTFCAVVITPAGAHLYVYNANGLSSTNDPTPLAPQTFGNDWRLGLDADAFDPFYGDIDEVAIFGSALSTDQINRLYLAAKTGISQDLKITHSGSNVTLTWAQGTLLQAPSLSGAWTTNSAATSPYTVPAAGTQFYRLNMPVVP